MPTPIFKTSIVYHFQQGAFADADLQQYMAQCGKASLVLDIIIIMNLKFI